MTAITIPQQMEVYGKAMARSACFAAAHGISIHSTRARLTSAGSIPRFVSSTLVFAWPGRSRSIVEGGVRSSYSFAPVVRRATPTHARSEPRIQHC